MRLRPRFSNSSASDRPASNHSDLGWPRLKLQIQRLAGRSSPRTERLSGRWQMSVWRGGLPTWAEVQRLPLSLMIACLLAALGTVQMTFLIGNGLYRNHMWQQEIRSVKLDTLALNTDLRVLNEALAHADDPQELQAQARCLGFVGRSETVIVDQNAQGGTGGNNCDAVRMP